MLKIFASEAILPGRFYKRIEQRMNGKRFGFVFGMKLARYEEGVLVPRQLDDLDKFSVRRNAAKDETFFFKNRPKLWIKFIPMTMAFADLRNAFVDIASERVFSQPALPVSKTHSAAIFLDTDKIAKLEDDREGRFLMKLGRISVTQPRDIAGKFNTSCLHPKTYTEVGCSRFAGISDSTQH